MATDRRDYTALVQEARGLPAPQLTPRINIIESLPEPARFNLVHIITGARRCGKTFYLFQLMRRLQAAGVPSERMFYFNFADDRLKPQSPTLLNDVVEEYWRQIPKAREQGCYLFLDEVQEAEGWQGFCQRIAEHETVTLVISGSSSKLSADEIASTFRGRSQEHQMSPLSFREYCSFHEVKAPEAAELREAGDVSPQTRTSLEAAFDRYLEEGGFPGVQKLSAPDRLQILQGYLRDVVARDVVERYKRADIALANQVALFCMRNTACELSINNLVDSLRQVGYRTSWETVNEMVRLFCQAHMISLLPEYSTSLAPTTTSTPKVYALDQGMAFATSRANQQDVGKRLETAIHAELARRCAGGRSETLTSFTTPGSKREKIDFLVGDALATEPYELYQVTADMSAEKTRHREIGSLQAAMKATGIKEGTVITLREEDELETDVGPIHVVPAWKWALEG